MKAVRLAAHAKLNLTLDVVGRRPDGFHELRSVMARISLADEVRVARAHRWRVTVRPPLGASGPDLAERAARALARRLSTDAAAAILVRKRIPIAAGLGGGSSDAAHVLRALGALWDVDVAVVREVAREVGSDVPFFLDGALAEVRGRGEEVRPLGGGPWHGVLVVPRCRVATADAFARLGAASWSDGSRTATLARAIAAGEATAPRLRALCGNDLDGVASALCPEIAAVRASVAVPLFLSGSGPSLFAIADDRGHSLAIRRQLRRADVRAAAIVIAAVPESVRTAGGRPTIPSQLGA